MASTPSSIGPRRFRAAARRFMVAGLLVLLIGVYYGELSHASPARFVAFSAGQPPGGGGHVTNLTVNLTDRPSFDPSSLAVPSGNVLAVQIHNQGLFNHSFTIAAQPNHALSNRLTPAELYAYFAANGSLVNVTLAPGASRLATIPLPTSASAGSSFEFVSVVPYQFQAGMRGFLNVTGTPSGPGIVLTEQATDAFRFVPDSLGASGTGYPLTVDVQVTNAGSSSHTWTIAAQPNLTLNPGNFSSYFSAHPPAARASLPNGGMVVWANFTVNGPGVYEFICEISGHFTNGMFGFLYVGLPVPSTGPPPSTAIVQEGILIGAGSLLGIGVVFALAGTFVGRFPKPPNERSY